VVSDATADGPEPLVASLARPDGNITGLGASPLEFSEKALELLQAAVPGVARVAVLTEHLTPELVERRARPMEAAAHALGLTLAWTEVETRDQVADALEAAVRHQPDALVVYGDATMYPARRQVAAFALRHRLPTVTNNRELVEEGALLFYNYDN